MADEITRTGSFPFTDLARRYGVDRGDVWILANGYKPSQSGRTPGWEGAWLRVRQVLPGPSYDGFAYRFRHLCEKRWP